MTISYSYEATEQLDFDYEALMNKVIEACMDYEECPYEAEISILLTDDKEIQKINQEFRDKDMPTDVLSFPGVEYVKAGDFSNIEENYADCFHPESGELILGDIVISVERAKLQAKEYEHSVEREIAFLTAHSMFHLFGYDHMEEEECQNMEEKQRDVMNILHILR